MRLPKIFRTRSLESKCRWVFALAVSVIMLAVLFWPWYRMESLVDEQNLYVSREAARLELIARHRTPRPAPAEPEAALDVEVFGRGTLPPRWLPAEEPTDPEGSGLSVFELRSLRHLRTRPGRTETYMATLTSDGGRVYNYLVLLKNTGECVSCHGPESAVAGARRFGLGENMAALSITLPLPGSDWSMAANRAVIVLAGVLGVITATVVFYWIAHTLFLGPVYELENVAAKVTEGDLTARSGVQTGDEFQKLSEAVNRMIENLVAGQERLRQANVGLDIKLGELGDRIKTEFLTNVTHELRTPLNSIIGFAELLKESLPRDEKAGRYASNILSAGRSLLELINDLLDLAKIEAGKMELHPATLSVSELCETLVSLIKPLADLKDLTVAVDISPSVPAIHTDPAKVQQIIYNLLSNAVKFTPRGGRVGLTARPVDEATVEVSVSDTGPGIAPEHHQAIFEKFRQIDASVTREHAGTGLGLAISQELAGLLGGRIRVQSRPGAGAVFTLTLPVNGRGRTADERQESLAAV
jgi:signal transduction histidine kinase